MKNRASPHIFDQYSDKKIVETLHRFISDRRHKRIDGVIKARLNTIQLAIESPSDINNALAAVRSCEALGISTVHMIQPEGDARYARAVTQGAVYWVDVVYHNNIAAFTNTLKSQGFVIAGAIMSGETPLHSVPINKPLCLLIGNEQRGLSSEAKQVCDYLYRIPMYGMSESMNLSVAAAISIYDTSQRKRKLLDSDTDLTSQQAMELRAKYYLNSVNQRLIEGLFPQN